MKDSEVMLNQLNTLPEALAQYTDRNPGTLWQVIKAYRANQRQGTVGVKTRSMVRSTGKKPYKQKKTGNARRGSFVSPIHVGGGVAHGPKARDYREIIPKKMQKVALGLALAKRIESGSVFLGTIDVPSGKTKEASCLLNSTCADPKSVLLCLHQPSQETLRAFRNIRKIELISPEQINALHILQKRNLVLTSEALNVIELRLAEGNGEE